MMRLAWLAPLLACGLTAQTPPTASTTAPQPAPKVLRHLEFAFAASEQGMGESHFNGSQANAGGSGNDPSTAGGGPPASALMSGSGVSTYATSDGASGTMDVDVLGIASDSGLIVQISEWVHNEVRARQAYVCEVYGNTTVNCPPSVAPSQAEMVLLAYLGRQFVNAAPWDAKNHWQQTQRSASYTLQEDFARTSGSQPSIVLVHETKKYEMHSIGFGNILENVDITYDNAMEVPTAVRDDVTQSGGSGSEHDLFTFQLQHDSLAKS